jgi:WD40 repeat protein
MRFSILALCLAAAAPAAEIPKGAHVLLRMMNSINTRTAQEGDYVYLHTSTPIVADGRIVAPVNSYVQGVVTMSKRSGRAELSIRLEREVLTGKPGRAIEAHSETVEGLAISPDSRSLASVSRDGGTKIWEIESGKLLLAEAQRHPHGVAYSPDGRRLVTNSSGEVVLWNLARGERERTMRTNSIQPHIATLTYSPDSKWVATGGGPGLVDLWDADTGKHLASLPGQTGAAAETCAVTATCAIESIAISPNGQWIAAGSDDDTVKLWRLH